jgi:hypothetical protein
LSAPQLRALWEGLVATLNHFGKGNAQAWLEALPGKLDGWLDQAAAAIRAALDGVSDKIARLSTLAREYAGAQVLGIELLSREAAQQIRERLARYARALGEAYTRLDAMKARINAWLGEQIAGVLGGAHHFEASGTPGSLGSRAQRAQAPPEQDAPAAAPAARRPVPPLDVQRARLAALSEQAAEAQRRGDFPLARARLEEARQNLREWVLDNPDIPNIDRPAALAERLDLSTPRDRGAFWSGPGTKQAAEQEYVTLAKTNGGRIVDDWDELGQRFPGTDRDPPPNGYTLWATLSEKYADGITGEVHVFQTPEVAARGGGYIWRTVEQPVLLERQASGDVGDIVIQIVK